MGARSANAPLTQSYDKGPDVPLIEATIGDFFDAIVSKYPEREALVSRHQISAGLTASYNSKSISWPVV